MGQGTANPMLGQFSRENIRLTSFTAGDQEIPLPTKPAITIRINEEGKLSGRSTMNMYFGSLQWNADGSISWGSAGFAVTRRTGPQTLMDLESLYLQALERTTKLTFEGSTLTFSSTDPAINLTFEVRAARHSVAEFHGTPLTLTQMIVDGQSRVSPPNPSLTINLNAMGTCSGFSGVNRYFGKFFVTPSGEMTAGPFGSTMMAGPPGLMELEAVF
jgi:heat shock protein HslJ